MPANVLSLTSLLTGPVFWALLWLGEVRLEEFYNQTEHGSHCRRLQLQVLRLSQLGGERGLELEAGAHVQLGHHGLCDFGPEVLRFQRRL